MPLRYAESAKMANSGVKLSAFKKLPLQRPIAVAIFPLDDLHIKCQHYTRLRWYLLTLYGEAITHFAYPFPFILHALESSNILKAA